MHVEAVQPVRLAPLGKPKRKTNEPAPLEIPETWPETVPEPSVPVPQKQPVPA